jgi:hypothetical protein
MRCIGKALSGLGTALLCLSGCWTTESQIKPPKPEPQYVLPPTDDSRFSSPPDFPEKTLNNGLQKKERDPNGPPDGMRPSRFGAGGGPGMGGY